MQQPLRTHDPELRELRHRYNRLCARFAGTSDMDPASAADSVQELQELSDRIVAIEVRAEMAGRDGGRMDRTGSAEPERAAGREAPLANGTPLNIVALRGPRAREDGEAGPRPSSRTASPPAVAAEDGDGALGAAMQDWLRRNGLAGAPPATPPPEPAEAAGTAAEDPSAEDPGTDAPQAVDFDRLYDLIEVQQRQIAAVLDRCEEHQRQLESMERRLVDRYPAKLLGPQLEALGAGLDQQRQRITALAITLQRLLQWLAAERHRRRD